MIYRCEDTRSRSRSEGRTWQREWRWGTDGNFNPLKEELLSSDLDSDDQADIGNDRYLAHAVS